VLTTRSAPDTPGSAGSQPTTSVASPNSLATATVPAARSGLRTITVSSRMPSSATPATAAAAVAPAPISSARPERGPASPAPAARR